jgi:hypothetical protein
MAEKNFKYIMLTNAKNGLNSFIPITQAIHAKEELKEKEDRFLSQTVVDGINFIESLQSIVDSITKHKSGEVVEVEFDQPYNLSYRVELNKNRNK